WRGTERARELREVVGGVQAIDRLAPAVAVDEVVPVRNQVAQRTALVTERDAAVHAAGALLLQCLGRPRQHDLLPVAHAFGDRPIRLFVPLELDEARYLAHTLPLVTADDRVLRVRAPVPPAQPIPSGGGVGGRYGCVSRLNSMEPVTVPMFFVLD